MSSSSSVRLPGVLLGIGLGGFVDGIVLHQILQWHHVVSHRESPATVRGLELNTLWDGVFHAGSWVAVVIGLALLWRRASGWSRALRGSASLWGWILAGWGGFNLLEGLINHHLLQLHHVRDDLGGPASWDVGFLVVGAAALLGGWFLQRRAAPGGSAGAGWEGGRP